MNTKKKMIGRILFSTVLILTLLVTMIGCGGTPQKTLTVNKDVFLESTDDGGLSMTDLSKIADMLASTCTTEFDTQAYLVAANRGYNMLAAGYDPAAECPTLGPNTAHAIEVIRAANDKAANDKKIMFDYTAINAADMQTLIDSFKTTVDLNANTGLLDGILGWIGTALNWITLHLGFGSYIVGICMFAVIIEILMLPFAIRQQKNSIRQAKLRPKEMAIRNKYRGRTDQATAQKMQQEIQEFYQKENFSPYSGCLPLLIQLPIIMALYSIVIDPLRYVLGKATGVSTALTTYYTTAKAAGGMGGVVTGNTQNSITLLADIKERGISILDGLKDFDFFTNGEGVFNSIGSIADKIPDFTIGGINFGLTPDFARFDVLLLVPVLTFGAYFLTSKINRKLMAQPTSTGSADDRQVACSNAMMDITMPLMSTFFTFMVPALIGVYWIFRSLIGLLKQFIISRIMPLPTFTEEDYKQAAKEMAGKRVVQKSDRVGKVRSLHHIDDEDFDDTRERALARKAAMEEEEEQERQKKIKKTPFEAPALKEERRDEKKADTDKDAEKKKDNQNEK